MALSNVVQLITSIQLLKQRQVVVLQASLAGSILTNLLLMTGLCFIIGGLGRPEQYFDPVIAQTISALLLLVVVGILTTLSFPHELIISPSERDCSRRVVSLSRGAAVIIFLSYALYIISQYFKNGSKFYPTRKALDRTNQQSIAGSKVCANLIIGTGNAATISGPIKLPSDPASSEIINIDDGKNQPQLSLSGGLILLIVFTILLAFNTQFATDNLQGLLQRTGITQTFVGLVIVPIVSSDFLCFAAAQRDRLDISIALTLERCMQTALLVLPCVILVAWGMGVNEMTLEFDSFITAALVFSILLVSQFVQKGKSNW